MNIVGIKTMRGDHMIMIAVLSAASMLMLYYGSLMAPIEVYLPITPSTLRHSRPEVTTLGVEDLNVRILSTDRTRTFNIEGRKKQSVNYFTDTYNSAKRIFPQVETIVDYKTDLYNNVLPLRVINPPKTRKIRLHALKMYMHALHNSNKPLLLLEDDVQIHGSIKEKIIWAIKQFKERNIKDYILDCSNIKNGGSTPFIEDLHKVKYLYGTVCMVYSKTVAGRVYNTLNKQQKVKTYYGYDHSIKKLNVPTYAFTRPLVKHLGRKSTGLAGAPFEENTKFNGNICIVTAFKEPHTKEYFKYSDYEKIIPYTISNMWKYAKQHDYKLYLFNEDSFDTSRKSSWVKIPLFRKYFKKDCDWVFYTDVDWLFMTDKPLPIDNNYDIIVSNECIRNNKHKKMSGSMLLKNSKWSKTFLDKWDGLYNKYKNVANHDQVAFENMMRVTPKEMKVIPPEDFMTYDTHNCVKPKFGIHFPAGNKVNRVQSFASDRLLSVIISKNMINYQIPYKMSSSDIIIGVLSYHKEKRMAMRKVYQQGNIYFIVGKQNGKFDYDEFYKYNDMIFIDMEEAYMGEKSILPYKTQTFLHICEKYIKSYNYILKIDDDTFVHMDKLRKVLSIAKPDYWGRVWYNNIIDRNPKSKWYVSRKAFPNARYPDYCSGAGYVLSRKANKCIITKLSNMRFMPMEDVATGILTGKCGISPVNSNKIQHMKPYSGNDFIIRHYYKYTDRKELKIELKGGLGNQLFQYSTGLSIAARQNAVLCGTFNENKRSQYLKLPACKKNHHKTIEKGYAVYDKKLLTSDFPYEYLQSFKYFMPSIKELHRKRLGIVNMMPDTIGIHIRLTDHTKLGYLTLPSYEWYSNLLSKLVNKRTKIYIFSDDIPKALELLPAVYDYVFDHRTPEEDMKLLASCSNIIISRGTFGWWAGYLSNSNVYYRPEFVLNHYVNKGKVNIKDYYPTYWHHYRPLSIETHEPSSISAFWNSNIDRKYMKKLYSQLKYDYILDIGARNYNKDCKSMLPTSSKYYQIDKNPPDVMNNDGYLLSRVEDVQTKYPNYKGKFDIILDFGVLGWEVSGKSIQVENYIKSILFLLKSGGKYILKIDAPYKIDRKKYIYPYFTLDKEDTVENYSFLHLTRKTLMHNKCVIVCHPDDESIWAGDILDSNTHVIVVTDANSSGLHVKRRKSLAKAMKIVGSTWEMWDLPETLNYERSNKIGWNRKDQKRLITKLNTLNCGEVYTHGTLGEYGHIDHRNLHKAVVSSKLTNIHVFAPKLNYGTSNEFNLKEKCVESDIHKKLLDSYEEDGTLGNAWLFRPICQQIKPLYPYRYTTIVSAYFNIQSKFSHNQYIKWMKNLMSVNDAMVIFTEEKYVDMIQTMRVHAPTKIISTTIEDFKSFKDYGEKYWLDQHDKDPEKAIHKNYHLYCIWNEKSNFIKQTIDINPFKSHFFAWMDIGYLRVPSYNGKTLIRTIPSDLSGVLLLNVGDIMKKNTYIGGGFIGGYISDLKLWHDKFYDNKLIYKDQPIMTSVCNKNPTLCYLVKAKSSKWDRDPWFYIAGLLHKIPTYKYYMCEKIHEIIADIHSTNVWYTTIVGSTLAAIRHHDGCSVDLDGDIEVKSLADAQKIATLLKQKYHVVSSDKIINNVKDASKGDEWYGTRDKQIIFRIFLCDQMSFPYVDIWLDPTKSKYYKILNGYKVKGRMKCKLGDIDTYCPINVIEYLEHKYTNWYKSTVNKIHYNMIDTGKSILACKKEGIDVVIPWSGENTDNSGVNRDDGIIKYSISSIQKYMPWVRYIIIYANNDNQPSFWNEIRNDNVKLYNRCTTFIGTCPTYNAFAVYANIFTIPYLSEQYIVIDDDIIINNHITKTDFFVGDAIKIRYRSPIAHMYPPSLIKYNKIKDLTLDKWVPIPKQLPKIVNLEAFHIPMGNIKSKWQEFYNNYPKWFKFISSHKLRFCFMDYFHKLSKQEDGNLNGACYQEDARLAYYWFIKDKLKYGGIIQNLINYDDISKQTVDKKLATGVKTWNINDSALWHASKILQFDPMEYKKRKLYLLSMLESMNFKK